MHRNPRKSIRLIIASAVLATVLPGTAIAAQKPNPAPVTVPAISSWQGGTGSLHLGSGSRIAVADPSLRGLGEQLSGELAEQGLRGIPVTTDKARPGDVALSLAPGEKDLGTEGYRLAIGDTAAITGNRSAGVFYGTRTLLQALRTAKDRASLPKGTARDVPKVGERGQMLDIRKFYPVSYLKQQIRQMSWWKMNTFHLHLSDWNAFRIQSDRFPGLTSKQAYSKRDLRELQDYARRYHVTIIPEIDLPGHASRIGAYRPDLSFSCRSLSYPADTGWEGAGTGHWMLDVTKKKTLDFLRSLLDEIVPLFDSPRFHIGGDELPNEAEQQKCPELVDYAKKRGFSSTADVFADFINQLNPVIRAHGKQTEVWQWWDLEHDTAIKPDRNVVVDEWKSAAPHRAQKGYPTIGTEEAKLYVSAGFGKRPGTYGYFDPREVYGSYDFSAQRNILGYKVSRWSDRAHNSPASWFDFYARRPIAVLAARTWGEPAGDVRAFFDRYDRVGDADPANRDYGANPGMLSQQGWRATDGTNDGGPAIDNDPYTAWNARPESSPVLRVDLGKNERVSGIRYLPPYIGASVDVPVRGYEILGSPDGKNWHSLTKGEFPDTEAETVVRFAPTTVRHLAMKVLSSHAKDPTAMSAVAEFDAVRG
ncbi:family 20 glycosylhydrolase [Sciscionella sediminilitoris]|uniref:family 20 glycosylhydrolase n=1 Tax=Sciscionella sediminilitoris TaxID=1445613 RepID=UPI00055D226B|nr:family 20 glycosylhydrolase [Sciscionella sp. SE31]